MLWSRFLLLPWLVLALSNSLLVEASDEACKICKWTAQHREYYVNGQCKPQCSPRPIYTRVIPCTCEGGALLDIQFMQDMEGYELTAYVPAGGGKSGVTIASGVDLGQVAAGKAGRNSFIAKGITDSALLDKFEPYFALKGDQAKQKLRDLGGFTIKDDQGKALNLAYMTAYTKAVESTFNARNTQNKVFVQLPCGVRTVLSSLYYQFKGNLLTYSVFRYALNGNWDSFVSELRAFDQCYCQRRNQEADIVESTPAMCSLTKATATCNYKTFETSMAAKKSCEQSDVDASCSVHTALVQIKGPQFYGSEILVSPSFTFAVENINGYAASCAVLVNVLSSFPDQKISGVNLGRSFEFTVKGAAGVCDATCLSFASLPDDVTCFIDKIKTDGTLKLMGAGKNLVTDTAALTTDNDKSMSLAKNYTCFKPMVLSGQRVEPGKVVTSSPTSAVVANSTGPCPTKQHACDYYSCRENTLHCGTSGPLQVGQGVCSATFGAAVFAQFNAAGKTFADRSSLCVQNELAKMAASSTCSDIGTTIGSMLPTCLTTSGLCSIANDNFNALKASYASSSSLWSSVCETIGACMLPKAQTDAMIASCPNIDQSNNGYTTFLSGVSIPYAAQLPVSTLSDEYANPFPNEDWVPPLLDACSPDSCCSSSCVAGIPTSLIGIHYTVSQVLSSFTPSSSPTHVLKFTQNGGTLSRNRFARIHPRAIRCIERLWEHMGEEVVIRDFYRTKSEMVARGEYPSRLQTGGAARIALTGETASGKLQDLAVGLVARCLPLFREVGLGMRVGLFADSVQFEMLNKDTLEGYAVGSAQMQTAEFNQWLHNIADNTRLHVRNMQCAHPRAIPFRQSPSFKRDPKKEYRRGVLDFLFGDSEYCKASQNERETQFNRLWTKIERQLRNANPRSYRSIDDIKGALSMCFMSCEATGLFSSLGNMFSGGISSFDKKVEACDDLLHWLPFGFGSTEGSCHFYSTATNRMRDNACFWGRCMDKTPLYSMIREHFTATFTRPLDPEKNLGHSEPETLFSDTLNPTPVFFLLQRLFAMHCSGKATVWVNDGADLNAMRLVLQILIGYNKEITFVDVKTYTANYFEVVNGVENYIEDWKEALCRESSREYLAPVVVTKIGDSISSATSK